MRESALERFAAKRINIYGGYFFKWVCPGMSGVPDRICIFPGGRIVFAEFKAPGSKDGLSARQKKVIAVLKRLGCDVRRIGSKEEIEEMLRGGEAE